MVGHGVEVDDATLNRWVVKYAPLIAATAKAAGCRILAHG